MTKWPEPFLYAHELIQNGRGVWLGTSEKGICEQAHTPGETGEEVVTLYTADQVRSIVRAEMEECAKLAESQFSNVAEKLYGQELAALIRGKIKEDTDARKVD